MDETTKNKLKKRLLAEKKRVEEALHIVSDSTHETLSERGNQPIFPDYGDDNYTELEDNSPNEVADYAGNVGVTANLDDEINRINKALASIEEGTYGTCDVCGKEIDPKRLEVYPAATKCVKCIEK